MLIFGSKLSYKNNITDKKSSHLPQIYCQSMKIKRERQYYSFKWIESHLVPRFRYILTAMLELAEILQPGKSKLIAHFLIILPKLDGLMLKWLIDG
jgi:hypothetical protein